MLVDRFDGIEEDETQIKYSNENINSSNLTNDLEQLKSDIDIYIDWSSKLNNR